jgi:hypothetical protein
MSVTKSYVDPTTGIYWHLDMPVNPQVGSAYTDPITGIGYVWEGTKWCQFSISPPHVQSSPIPTDAQLEKHPTLKQAWEEYMVIRKLIGL